MSEPNNSLTVLDIDLEKKLPDVSGSECTEEQLRNSEECFRRIFEDGPLGMTIAGSDFRFLRANHAFCRMMGYSEQELTTLTFKDITHPDHLTADGEAVNKLCNGQIPVYRTEKRYLRKNGDIIWCSLTLSAVRDKKGDFLYFLSMVEDVTERKQAEIELQRINNELKERNRVKNEFVSTVSHELRTPLCVFKNIISNALAGVMGSLNPKLRKNLKVANQNIDRLARIVSNFLDIAKIEAGKIQLGITQMAIQSVISEVAEAFMAAAASKNISIDTVMPDNNVIIEGDRDKLAQVLINLLGNAVKFVLPNGHILITLSDHKDQISVSVHDDGPGIEPEFLDRIFNRFELGATSMKSGQPSTGLGLAISRELVGMHHGRIWAESAVGRGSTFTFILPKIQPANN